MRTIPALHKDSPRTPKGLKQTTPTSLVDAGPVRVVFIQVGEAIRLFGHFTFPHRFEAFSMQGQHQRRLLQKGSFQFFCPNPQMCLVCREGTR